MRTYMGCIILESLVTPEPVAGWAPCASNTVDMPNDPDATTWNVCWYQLSEDVLKDRVAALAAAMRPQWYGHFWSGDDLLVILAIRAFWAKASDRSTWQEFMAYGDTVGIERKWTESIPTELPAWVQAALEHR